jgi:hypothetical protein
MAIRKSKFQNKTESYGFGFGFGFDFGFEFSPLELNLPSDRTL